MVDAVLFLKVLRNMYEDFAVFVELCRNSGVTTKKAK
jgi:hypothetical protein